MSRLATLILVVSSASAVAAAPLLAVAPQAADEQVPQLPSKKDAIPTLTVSGHAELNKPADELQVHLGVVTEGEDAQTTMQENSRRMNAIVAALNEVGLTEDEYETSQFQIQPRYSRPGRQHEPDWKPQIIGYQVTNRLAIETKKLDLIGRLLEAATEAGANSIDSIGFGASDPRKHRAEAIKTATENARADARALAEAAGLRLVRVLSINLDQAMAQPPMPMPMMARGMAMAEAADTPPISPGDITVHATVTIVYEIASVN